jgi:hypothetical protein
MKRIIFAEEQTGGAASAGPFPCYGSEKLLASSLSCRGRGDVLGHPLCRRWTIQRHWRPRRQARVLHWGAKQAIFPRPVRVQKIDLRRAGTRSVFFRMRRRCGEQTFGRQRPLPNSDHDGGESWPVTHGADIRWRFSGRSCGRDRIHGGLKLSGRAGNLWKSTVLCIEEEFDLNSNRTFQSRKLGRPAAQACKTESLRAVKERKARRERRARLSLCAWLTRGRDAIGTDLMCGTGDGG